MPKVAGWKGELVLGRYRILSPIGQGGMALVYQASDERLHGRDVVVKVPHPALLQDEDFAGRFAREIHSLIGLSHAHIVDILDTGEHGGLPFVVLKYLSGGSLRDRISGGSPLQRLQALTSWMPDVAKALDFIHGEGYVHRDVKPDNILFDGHGHVYLSDFGIAKALSAHEASGRQATVYTVTGLPLGTPRYMPPELILGKDCDGHSDQYALAVTVYEMLSGHVPYDGASPTAIYELQKRPPVALDVIVPAVPRTVTDAVLRALSLKPADRFPTCREFAQAILQSLGETTATPAAPQRTIIQSVKVRCPSCHQSSQVSAGNLGEQASCSHCGSELPTDAINRAETDLNSDTDGQSTINTPTRPSWLKGKKKDTSHSGTSDERSKWADLLEISDPTPENRTIIERPPTAAKRLPPRKHLLTGELKDRVKPHKQASARNSQRYRILGGIVLIGGLALILLIASQQLPKPPSPPAVDDASPLIQRAVLPTAMASNSQAPTPVSTHVAGKTRPPDVPAESPKSSSAPRRTGVDVVIKSVKLLRTNPSGDVWDRSGNPDPKVTVEDISSYRSYTTPAAQDVHYGSFDLTAFRVPVGTSLRVTVHDEDVFEDDFAGSTTVTISDEVVRNRRVDLSFGRVDSLVLEFKP